MDDDFSAGQLAPTHAVFNQAPPLEDCNLYENDVALREAVAREGASWAEPTLRELGAKVGSAEAIEWACEANRSTPELRRYDRHGRRLDRVDYCAAYHRLMELSIGYGLHALHVSDGRPGAGAARAALVLLAGQNEQGHLCPISMTGAGVPVLRMEAALAAEWVPRVTSRSYDPALRPAAEKRGALLGMAMTEKQGGSDVRANTTRARADGTGYRLTGHKWFCSAPMSDAFLMLAQAPGGLTCFLVPRLLPDGERNGIAIERLKDKLGNRSNASSEIELRDAWGHRIGDEGRGVATIIEMVNHTRVDCALGSAALMRNALVQALHHARTRSAFGKTLAQLPLMQAVLADLSLESEAATALVMRLSRTADAGGEREAALGRMLLPAVKYWLGKRAVAHTAEALECLGGNGYTEDFVLARAYREAPLNSVWEGSGNIIGLDLLRALRTEPLTRQMLLSELDDARGADPRLDRFVASLQPELGGTPEPRTARRLAERIALAVSGSLLVRNAPHAIADAFCAARLSEERSHSFGALPHDIDASAILTRALP